MAKSGIPNPVTVVVGRALAAYYSYHGQLNDLFVEKGAQGDPPPGTRHQKAIEWLKHVSGDDSVDALEVLGGVLEKFMEAKHPAIGSRRRTPAADSDMCAERVLAVCLVGAAAPAQNGIEEI